MAEQKGVDPFEAFKHKKAAEEKQKVEQAKQDEANKKSGWVEGIGPAATGKPDPSKPKGFNAGRYQKTVVKDDELKKLRPEHLEETRLAKPVPTNVEKLPPEDKRRPKKFGKY